MQEEDDVAEDPDPVSSTDCEISPINGLFSAVILCSTLPFFKVVMVDYVALTNNYCLSSYNNNFFVRQWWDGVISGQRIWDYDC